MIGIIFLINEFVDVSCFSRRLLFFNILFIADAAKHIQSVQCTMYILPVTTGEDSKDSYLLYLSGFIVSFGT
jgi:hypothetical protein